MGSSGLSMGLNSMVTYLGMWEVILVGLVILHVGTDPNRIGTDQF